MKKLICTLLIVFIAAAAFGCKPKQTSSIEEETTNYFFNNELFENVTQLNYERVFFTSSVSESRPIENNITKDNLSEEVKDAIINILQNADILKSSEDVSYGGTIKDGWILLSWEYDGITYFIRLNDGSYKIAYGYGTDDKGYEQTVFQTEHFTDIRDEIQNLCETE